MTTAQIVDNFEEDELSGITPPIVNDKINAVDGEILDGSDNATVVVDNQVITIDCGGSCGDITIGIPVQ